MKEIKSRVMSRVPNRIEEPSRLSASTVPRFGVTFCYQDHGCRTRFSPQPPYVTPHQPLSGCPHSNLTAHLNPTPYPPSKPHLSPPTTTTHDARAPQTVRAPPDLVSALASVHYDVADPPLPHAAHAFHVLVTWLPLRPPHWMVPRRPAWGEADEGGLGRDLVLGLLWRPVCGWCRICVQT